jgi:hypothetical protein
VSDRCDLERWAIQHLARAEQGMAQARRLIAAGDAAGGSVALSESRAAAQAAKDSIDLLRRADTIKSEKSGGERCR